ncbi:MAG: thiamine phosphate synthase [Hyphomicrobiales bacterium]|nr:thiamine phosphate synthase [Hyphomicrobiales bacterium]
MLHRFYPIARNAAWVARLTGLGVKTIQLRVKDESAEAIREHIRDSLAACAAHGCQLIVNDYWEAAIALGADYVHLGQEDLAAADLPAIKRAGLKLGVSTHNHDELRIALAAEPDYVALGPIYETTLKAMPFGPQGLPHIGEWKRLVTCPLVAIGGITLERAPGVFAAGADSIAVVSDVTSALDPDARISSWLQNYP